MPIYHFNIYNAHGDASDDEGNELPDLAAACALGIEGVRSLLAEEVTQGEMNLCGRLEIVDSDGQLLRTIPFEDVLRIARPSHS